jgi:ABC-2 type transport system permease protein
MSLWRLEVLRLWRTQRWLILLAVFVSFGLLGPLTARYLPDLLESLGEDALGSLPPMTEFDGVTQYVGNAAQIGLLAVVFVAAAALAFDAKPEMAIFLRTRSDVRDIVVPRYVVSFVASVVGFVIGMTIAYVLTGLLLGWLDVAAVAIGSALFGLYLAFAVAVVALVASLVRGVPAVAMLSVGVLVALALAGLVPQIAPYLPSELVGAADWLVRGGDFDFWRAVVATIGLTLAMLAISIRRLETREL